MRGLPTTIWGRGLRRRECIGDTSQIWPLPASYGSLSVTASCRKERKLTEANNRKGVLFIERHPLMQ